MNKKLISTMIITCIVCILLGIGNYVSAVTYEEATTPEEITIEYIGNNSKNKKCVFANGTPVTIETDPENAEGAIVKWNGGQIKVTSDYAIIGGKHNHNGILKTTSITMNGGKIKTIIGGGLHKSHVENTNVVINGGQITSGVNGGGASSYVLDTCGAWYNKDDKLSPTVVDNANLTINEGTIYTAFGGGEGFSVSKTANIKVTGGTIEYLTAGGSNGYTGEATLDIQDGNIKIAQSVNRGRMDEATTTVTGGTIETLYIGGESDPGVTGTIEKVTTAVKDEANVLKLDIGFSGGKVISKEDTAQTAINVSFDSGTVKDLTEDQFTKETLKEYVTIIIDNKEFKLEKGLTLKDLNLSAIKEKENYEFLGFVLKGNGMEFSENTKIEEKIELEAVYEKIVNEKDEIDEKEEKDEKDETPKTSAEYYIEIALIINIIAICGIVLLAKKKRK